MSEPRFQVIEADGHICAAEDCGISGDGRALVAYNDAENGQTLWCESGSLHGYRDTRVEWLPTERERKLEAALGKAITIAEKGWAFARGGICPALPQHEAEDGLDELKALLAKPEQPAEEKP